METRELEKQLTDYLIKHKDEHIEVMKDLKDIIMTIKALESQHFALEKEINRVEKVLGIMVKTMVIMGLIIIIANADIIIRIFGGLVGSLGAI